MRHHGIKEIASLLDYYQKYNYITKEENVKAKNEWASLKVDALQRRNSGKKSYIAPYDIYSSLLKSQSAREEMPNILVLVEIMMSISVSTASCERGFSQMNNEKSSLRTRMKPEILDDVLRINVERISIEDFDPIPAYTRWIADGPKHCNGHKLKAKMETNGTVSLLHSCLFTLTSKQKPVHIQKNNVRTTFFEYSQWAKSAKNHCGGVYF